MYVVANRKAQMKPHPYYMAPQVRHPCKHKLFRWRKTAGFAVARLRDFSGTEWIRC